MTYNPNNRIDAYQAACIIRDLRRGHRKPERAIEMDGAIAELVYDVDGAIVVLRETDELSDWRRYNLRWLPSSWPSRGANHRWHRGFLRYAKLLYGWVKANEPDLIVGFSLGGAAAQIIGSSLRVPTIALGAPRTLWQWSDDEIAGESCVAIWNGMRDPAGHVPPGWLRYHHVGREHRLPVGLHAVEAYCGALE